MPNQPANTISIQDFTKSVLPKLIDGREILRVFFSTYNNVTDYPGGMVETEDPKLEIMVAAGGAQPPSLGQIFHEMDMVLAAVAAGNFATAEKILDTATLDTRQGQSEVAIQLATQAAKYGYPDVAVIYAGLSAFASTIEMARRLHRESPETFIAVLTCDCDLEAKKSVLGAIEGIGATIVTPYCGGRSDMRDILNAFKERWPNRILRT